MEDLEFNDCAVGPECPACGDTLTPITRDEEGNHYNCLGCQSQWVQKHNGLAQTD